MFQDRRDAGRRLGERLADMHFERPVVLAIPRGGVEVGVETARAINAELDVALVRKLRHPAQPELAIGAVGEEGEPYVNERTAVGLDREAIDHEVRQRREELQERSSRYREAKSVASLEGRDAILVDDGVATGSTMEAALRVTRARGPRRVIVALPVAPPAAVDRLSGEADEVVCLDAPESFAAVGQFYERFDQTTDEQVVQLLHESQEGAEGR